MVILNAGGVSLLEVEDKAVCEHLKQHIDWKYQTKRDDLRPDVVCLPKGRVKSKP